MSKRRVHIRWSAMLAAVAVVVVGFGLTGQVAEADTAPPSATTPKTVSSDVLPTVQINGVVWTQLVVGDTVYAGGSFTTARPSGAASGTGTVARSNLLAYRLSTGALLPAFAPKFNGTVRALAASSDGATIYAGGDFTAVGSTAIQRLAAVNASTGALNTGFAPQPNGSVRALARTGSTLFAGGSFTRLGSTNRSRAAAVNTSGAVLSWAPAVADGYVDALVVNAALGRVALAGSFSGLNGNTTSYRGSALVDATTGTTTYPWPLGGRVQDYGANAAITSLSSDGVNIYGTGYDYGAGTQGNLEGTFSAAWSTGTLRWIEDCHGDSYSSGVLSGTVYIAGHPHDCRTIGGFPETTPRTHHRALAFSTAATGTVAHNTVSSYDDWYGSPAPSLLT